MDIPNLDDNKLAQVKEIIDKGAALIEEIDYHKDKRADKELASLQEELRRITGKKKLSIRSFAQYWACTDLETAARIALMPEPVKTGMTDEQITKLFYFFMQSLGDEAITDYFLNILKVETGLENITDYIFWPDLVGLDLDASEEAILRKILEDRKKTSTF